MTQVTGPALGVYDSAGLERGPGTYISNQLSWDAAAADPNETRGLRLPFCRLSVEGGAERKAHCWRGGPGSRHTPVWASSVLFLWSGRWAHPSVSGDMVARTHLTLGGPQKYFSFKIRSNRG